mgnify:CR=1 FL=1
MDEIKLIKIQNPFNRQDRIEELVDYHYENLQVIRDSYFPKDVDVVVSVNGGIVPTENLSLVTLKPGDAVIFYPSVEGGGDILRAVASLALVAVAIWAPYAMGLYTQALVWGGTAELGFAAMAAGGLTVGGALVSAGIMMVGGFLINALLPAPVPDIDSYSGSSFDNSNTYSWSPVTRQQQGLVIPKFYGIIPVNGNIISTYTENISDKNYVNVLLHVGQGPINRLYDYYINDQPTTNLTGVEVVTKYGQLNQSVIPNFNDTKTEYTTNVNCKYNTPYIYETTGDAFDGLEVDITFPRGLYYANDRGGLDSISVDIMVEIKKQGDTNWTSISQQAQSVAYTVDSSYWAYGYWVKLIMVGIDMGTTTWYQIGTGSSNPYDHFEGELKERYYSIDASGYYSETCVYWRWISATSVAYADTMVNYTTVTDAKNSAIIKTFKSETNLSHGKYDIRVTRLTPDYNDARYGATSYLTAVREVFKDDFEYPCSALVGIKALASDQLSGSFKFRCMMEGAIIRYYDGSNWRVGFNNNPAWVCYDVLTQPLLADPDEVIGTDNLNYRCIASHTSSSDNKPITGANYDLYWQQGGDQGKTWETGKTYNSWNPEALRYDGINPSRLDTETFKAWADWCDELVPSGKDTTDLISTASEVIGTDGLNYSCILNHTSANANKPITGANWSTYWTQTGTGGGSWQEGKNYKSNFRKATSSTSTTLTDNTKSWYYNIHRDKVLLITAGTGVGQRRLIVSNSDDTLTVYPEWTTPLSTDSEYTIRQDYERRFSFNGGFDSGTTLWEAVLQIALMSRALLIWDGTTIKVIIDRAVILPDDAVQLFSMGNIDTNSFEETFLSSSERTGEIEINFINKDIDYEKDSMIVLNPALDKPENRNTITLAGTTIPSQAYRMGNFLLKQNELLKRTIKFDAEIDAITCMIGDVVYFQHDVPQWGICGGRVAESSQVLGGDDGLNYTCILNHTADANNRPGMSPPTPNWSTYWTQAGDAGATWVSGSSYVTASTSNTITLDQEVTIENGKTYSIMVWHPNDTSELKTVITSPGTTNKLTISGTWTTNPVEYSNFAFGESDNTAKPFRIIEVSRTGDLKCTIRAIEYNSSLYSGDSSLPILPTTTHTTREAIAVVTNLTVSEIASVNESGASNRQLLVRFNKPVNVYYSYAEVWYKEESTPYTYAGRADTTEFYISNVRANTTYTVMVKSVSFAGIKTSIDESPTATITTARELSTYSNALSSRITGLEIFNQRNDTTFKGKDCKFVWNPITPIDSSSTGAGNEATGAGTYIPTVWLKDYEVKIFDSTGTVLRRTEYVTIPEYTYTFEKNYEDGSGTPVRSFQIQVKARDTFYRVSSVPAKLTVTNDAPTVLKDITVTSGTGYYIVEFAPSTAPDLLGYKVHASQTSGFTPSTANLVNEGTDTRIVISPSKSGIWYVKVAAYDSFGAIDLNYSSEYSVYVTKWLEYDDLELELMKMTFQSISWAQFAIFDDFTDETKRSSPDPFPYEATLYKNSIVAGTLPNTVYGWTSKTFFNMTTVESGTSTSVGLNYLADSTKDWFLDEVKNLTLIDSSSNSFTVLANSSYTLTVSGTPSAGAYKLKDDNPAYMVCFCTFEDSTEGGGNGFVKLEVSFDDGANYQTVLDTEHGIDSLEGTVAIAYPGTDYKFKVSLKTDADGNGPVVRKILIATDPSPWRW